MFLNAKIHFLLQIALKVVLKSVESHKKSSLKVYFDTNIKNSTLINRAWWQG